MMYGTKTGYSLTWKSNIPQVRLSLNKRDRRARHVLFPLGHYSRWRTASVIKNQFQDQLRLGQVITRVRLQFVEKIWERVCGKVPRSIGVPLFPWGIRTSHRSLPAPFPTSRFHSFSSFPLRYVTREKEVPSHF